MIAVLGAGAFGTALAVSLAKDGKPVTLVAKDIDHAKDMQTTGENTRRLPGVTLPCNLSVTLWGQSQVTRDADIILLALPAQVLPDVLRAMREEFLGKTLVACCKGINLETRKGPIATIEAIVPKAQAALLSGPSFAADIANGLPTALTLAARDSDGLTKLQTQLSTPNLRLYRSTDVTGVEIGGALKNVIAIACGICIGAGLGESARAALMTRGYAEMVRLATRLGAKAETLAGLSGFGDLALTCTSEKSRNFSYGIQLGRAGLADATATTEGVATAKAVSELSRRLGVETPISTMMAAVLTGKISIEAAKEVLLARPLTAE